MLGNLAGSVNVGNLMQGNLASSCAGGPPPGMWPGVGVSPNWNEAARTQFLKAVVVVMEQDSLVLVSVV